MLLFGKNLLNEVAYVAEVGVNHEGSPETAAELIRLAAESGADAVKLQTYTPERYASATDAERLARVARFSLDESALRELAQEASLIGIPLFSSALSEDVVPLLGDLFPAIKIASGDLNFEPVIRSAAKTGKPVILSTGAGTLDEIDTAVGWIQDEIGSDMLSDRLIILQCVSVYPASIDWANVSTLVMLAERFGVRAGYSNHVIGIEACLGAIAIGAAMIEVHFTNQKDGRDFRDHELSLEPSDLADLVARGELIRRSIGKPEKTLQPGEQELRNAIRKGIVAARALKAGTILRRDDLMFARPAGGFPAAEISSLLGQTLRTSLQSGESITKKDID